MILFKISIWQRFLYLLAPKVWLVKESLSEIRMEIQTFFKGTNFFFPRPILFHNSCIFLDFYLVLLKEICLRFIWSNGYSVKCPYIALHQCMYQFHLLHYTKKYKKYLSDIGGKWLYFIINMKPKGLDWNTKRPFVNSSSLKIPLRDKLCCQLSS